MHHTFNSSPALLFKEKGDEEKQEEIQLGNVWDENNKSKKISLILD